jgi:hypothetical protein
VRQEESCSKRPRTDKEEGTRMEFDND